MASFSFSEQFDNFGRGVISIAPIAFFLLLTVTALYLCMVLIGRRHWSGGDEGNKMFMHYMFRCLAMVAVVFGASYFFMQNDRPRFDVTQGRVSSLSPTTRQLLRQLDPERPIVIEAFISNNIPEQYSKTRYDLITLLKEFQSLAGGRNTKLQVRIFNDLETSSEEAAAGSQAVRYRAANDPRSSAGRLPRSRNSAWGRGPQRAFKWSCRFSIAASQWNTSWCGRSIPPPSPAARNWESSIPMPISWAGSPWPGGSFRQLPKQPIIEELEKQYDVEGSMPMIPSHLASTTCYWWSSPRHSTRSN